MDLAWHFYEVVIFFDRPINIKACGLARSLNITKALNDIVLFNFY